jgi:hypothetical protein
MFNKDNLQSQTGSEFHSVDIEITEKGRQFGHYMLQSPNPLNKET